MEGLSRVISVDDEHDALGFAWRQLALGFGSPQVSDGFKGDEVIERGPVSDSEFVWKITGVEGGCQRFDISQPSFMTSAQRRSLLPTAIPRKRATVSSRRSPSARSTTPLY